MALDVIRELGRVQLRNEYVVCSVSGGYSVGSDDNRGQSFGQFVPKEIVVQSQELLSGQDWTVAEAKEKLRPLMDGEDWPYFYGYKLHYFVQNILVTLVALGEAGISKEGNSFVYSVS